MIYILNSDNDILTKYYIDNLNINTQRYILDITKENAVNSFNRLMEYDLFAEDKIYILNNVDIFTHKKSILSAKSKKFCLSALNNSIYDCIIVQDKKAKYELLKQIECDYDYIEFNDNEENRNAFFKKFLKKNKIDISTSSFNLLKANLDNDLNSICNELIKLSTYENTITNKNINLLSYKNINSNVFMLLELIIKNDVSSSKLLYEKLIKEGNDPVRILGIMATQIKYIFQVTSLRQYKLSTILSKVGGSSYRIEITLKNYSQSADKKIIEIYHKIADADYLIKSGNAEPSNCLENIIFS